MSRLRTYSGFTLIELVIVLAIAALILAAILLAVGGAQRSQRDNTTKNSAGQVASALQSYASNNGGTMPKFRKALSANYLTNIKDGQGGAPKVGKQAKTGAGNEIVYEGQAVCTNPNASGPIIAGAVQQYAVDYYVENGKTDVCTDNT